MCVSIIDVTKPEDPKVVTQIPVEDKHLRCNSLGLAGTTLVVAHQTDKPGQPGAGINVYDVADPANPKPLSHFDTSGPHSRGVHYLGMPNAPYAYLSTGAKDFTPHNQLDDQFLMIVDLSDPAHPKETGRWWLPAPGSATRNRRHPGCIRSTPAFACTRRRLPPASRTGSMSVGSMADG